MKLSVSPIMNRAEMEKVHEASLAILAGTGMHIDHPVALSKLYEAGAEVEEDPFDRLTPREREVLQLIAEGNTNNEIALVLSISVKTVEKHRAHLMSKLDIHDVAGLVRFAVQRRLIFLSE